MKLRDLNQWPPVWVGVSRERETPAVPEDGVLEGVERLGHRLLLRININGQRRTATLTWDPPPSVGKVEAVLLASIGAKVRALGDRELPR